MLTAIASACATLVSVLLYNHFWTKRIQKGQYVLYLSDSNKAGHTNLFTEVIESDPKTRLALIRHGKTVKHVRWSTLQVLRLDSGYQLLVPEMPRVTATWIDPETSKVKSLTIYESGQIPRGAVAGDHNEAGVAGIPLNWTRQKIGSRNGKINTE